MPMRMQLQTTISFYIFFFSLKHLLAPNLRSLGALVCVIIRNAMQTTHIAISLASLFCKRQLNAKKKKKKLEKKDDDYEDLNSKFAR